MRNQASMGHSAHCRDPRTTESWPVNTIFALQEPNEVTWYHGTDVLKKKKKSGPGIPCQHVLTELVPGLQGQDS